MFWFGWTSAGSVHWISPILASTLWAAGAFLLFQAGLKYVSLFTHYPLVLSTQIVLQLSCRLLSALRGFSARRKRLLSLDARRRISPF